jgi:hypothetical protein
LAAISERKTKAGREYIAYRRLCKYTEQMKGKKKKKSMLFAVSKVQCEPNRHLEDSYFCLMKVSGFSMSSRNKMEYPNILKRNKANTTQSRSS